MKRVLQVTAKLTNGNSITVLYEDGCDQSEKEEQVRKMDKVIPDSVRSEWKDLSSD